MAASEARGAAPTGARPFSVFEWMVAARYLRARRREGFISVIAGFSFAGIMLGVATLIIVMSVMNGFRSELLNKIVGINGHIFVGAIDKPLTDYAELADSLNAIPGVKLAFPMVEGQALASSQAGAGGVLVRGVREKDIVRIPAIGNTIQPGGTLQGFDVSGGVAIGRRLAEQLFLRPGDTLTLTAPKGAETPFGVTPRIKSYPVVAVFEVGMSEFDAGFVYMPLTDAQAFFNRDGDATAIEIFLSQPERIDEARNAIDNGIERPITLSDWRQRNKTFFGVLEVERNVMFLILMLIVLVAALNIVSGLIMLVKDKSADIAILRTMGATRGSIMRIFLITGAAIGVVGTLAGFGLGLVISLNVENIRVVMSNLTGANLFPAEFYFLSRLPSEVNPREVATIVGMALVLSLIATLYPSWRAARLDPVEALRYE
ncbi:lipoprotein-releasing ABC transporter permease subunit [Alsobacter sp. SYSU M60028]|uniref:Lipoprotein-releasing ABC transporter permease subunit n=1 Tax=Alsobacter ponti TaxID=2962936 RepID=A0ABT1LAZ6_9HYPH|nr:lipoprotein-releasing ABC transporter permease subunit [Alsobacter ponti]MCP8938276.1 lipoprotein-releasing ABC transporter permease subunit [Alsobacter ponti]